MGLKDIYPSVCVCLCVYVCVGGGGRKGAERRSVRRSPATAERRHGRRVKIGGSGRSISVDIRHLVLRQRVDRWLCSQPVQWDSVSLANRQPFSIER